MNIDILLSIFFIVPLFVLGFQIDRLKKKKVLIIWISIAVLLVLAGILIEDNSNNEMRNLSYFSSQILLVFIVFYKTTRSIYFRIFNREPEFGKFPKHKIDYVYTFILSFGTMLSPILIDVFIFQKFN